MAPSAVVPHTFARAVAELRAERPRREITLTELPAPRRLAPYAFALGAAVCPAGDEEVASGRLVLLHDPAGQDSWEGVLRLVSYVTAELEAELAADQLLPEVGWSWLTDALAAHAPQYAALAGTVTQTISTRFGELASNPPAADLEIRASWTPISQPLTAHLSAWCTLLASAAGLPPPGVSALPDRPVSASG